MMHMTLHWGIKLTLLLDSWRIDSLLSYLLSLLACFLFSSFYQYMENLRLRFVSLPRLSPPPSHPSTSAPLLRSLNLRRFNSMKFVAALLFGVNSGIGYLLMLAIMSFNGGVFLAVVSGLSVGYFFFRTGDDEAGDVGAAENPCACA